MLIHYVIVRRDLPLGTLAAMVTHAAGESAGKKMSFRGATAVVLGVDDEDALKEAVLDIVRNKVDHVVITESDPPYDGQFMALGIVPDERDTLYKVMKKYNLLSDLILLDKVKQDG